MARLFLTVLMGFAACRQVWADCADDELDLCDDDASSPMHGCGDDPELDLCDDEGAAPMPMPMPMPSPMPMPMPKPMPMPNPMPMPMPKPMPMSDCDADEMDLCDEEDDAGSSPMPMPMPKPSEDGTGTKPPMPSPMPAPMPSQSQTPAVAMHITTFDTEMELDDVTKFDKNKFKEAMAAASSVSADNIEIGQAEYKTKVTYSMPEDVTKTAATTAIALLCRVLESQVEVTIISSRRLSESRRLATSIDAIISTQIDREVSSIKTQAADKAALKKAFSDGGVTVEPTVVNEPSTSVVVSTKLKGEAGAAAPEVPAEATLQTKVTEKMDTTVKATNSNVVKPTFTTTPTPTPTPTVAASENSVDGAKCQTSSTLIACAMATLVAVLLDAA